jgi:hypothetical protein
VAGATLIRSRTMHLCDDIAFRREPGLRYVAPSVRPGLVEGGEEVLRFPGQRPADVPGRL